MTVGASAEWSDMRGKVNRSAVTDSIGAPFAAGAWLPGLVLAASFALAGPLLADDRSASLGPFVRTEKIEGVEVAIPVSVDLTRTPGEGVEIVRARLTVGLGDLAAKAGSILAVAKLPSDPCKTYGLNPVVILQRQSVDIRDGALHLAIAGKADIWNCAANPLPATRVESSVHNLGWGMRARLPDRLRVRPGAPLKALVGIQPFEADVTVRLVKDGAKTIRLELGPPSVRLTGKYVALTKGILRAASVDVNALAKSALDKAIKPDRLRRTVPSLPGFDPSVESAAFVATNGVPAAEIGLRADVAPLAVFGLLAQLPGAIKAAN
ncbi:MAG: hypothetical protein U1E56_13555 [Bauldia sp.]